MAWQVDHSPPVTGSPPRGVAVAERVLAAQVQGLFDKLPMAVLSNLPIAAAVVWVFWGLRPAAQLLAWLGAVVLLAAGRMLHCRRYQRAGPGRLEAPRRWARGAVVGAALSGTAWAIGLAAFGPGASVETGLFLLVIVAGLLAGSAGTLSEHLPAFLAFASPVALSAAAVAISSGHPLERLLAPFVLLYLGAIARVAIAGDRRLRATLELGIRNEELVTDLSAAQAHLTALNAGLERRVVERSEQLARVERQLGQAALLASVGGLASSVAHEINNPIASVLANLGFLEEELEGDRPDLESCRDALSDARHGADRVRDTVRSLSAVARADHGGESVDLQGVLEACTSVVAGEMRRRAVLSRDYGQVPPVRGDTPGLAQVFIQLLLQTAWAIPEGAPAGRALLVRTAWDEARGRVTVEIAGPAGALPSADDAASDDVGFKLAGEVVARLGGQLEARLVAGAGPGFCVELLPARPSGLAAPC